MKDVPMYSHVGVKFIQGHTRKVVDYMIDEKVNVRSVQTFVYNEEGKMVGIKSIQNEMYKIVC